MNLVAALVYWIIVAIWLATLSTVLVYYFRNPQAFGTTRLLLAVIAIDTFRNVVENIYFGLYFGGRYELFPAGFAEVLGNPYLLILPKLANIAAGCLVLGLLLGRWLPEAVKERLASEQTAEELRRFAAIDGMSGLFNKSHFNVVAAAEWERCCRHDRALSLLMIDIDFFKSVNDSYGHEVGDRLIVQVANALREQQRKSDVVARMGGEEFALLLPETELKSAVIVAERLRELISSRVLEIEGGVLAITASIGVAEARDGTSLEELLKHADIALYDAKRSGRDRVCSYNARVTLRAVQNVRTA